MDFVLGRNTTYALSHNGNLLGHFKTELPPFTLRFEFSKPDYIPPRIYMASGSTWTKVQGIQENRWDFHYESQYWPSLFEHIFDNTGVKVKVVDGNLTGVTHMTSLFWGCQDLVSVCPLNSGDAIRMNNMFYFCHNLLWVGTIETKNVITMQEMFTQCFKLKAVNFTDTSKVEDMSVMFQACWELPRIPNMNTASLTNAAYMFNDCRALKTVPLFDMSKVTNIRSIFDWCDALETVPRFNFSSVTFALGAFNHCEKLRNIPAFNFASLGDASYTFNGCYSVESGILDMYNSLKDRVTQHSETFNNCGINTVTGAAELAQIPDDWK